MARDPEKTGQYRRWQTDLFRESWFSRAFYVTMRWLASPNYHWAYGLMADDLADARTICDVGCGNGLMSRRVSEAVEGRTFLLVEPSLSQLRAGEKMRAEMAQRNTIKTLNQPAEEFAPEPGSVDVLFSTGSINLWTDPARGLERCFRAVKPGGVVWIFDQGPCNTLPLVLDAVFVKRIFGVGIPGYTMEQVLDFATVAGQSDAPQSWVERSLYALRWQRP